MSTFSGVAWLLLCACTGVTAGHVSATTTPGLCAGKPVMEKLDRLERLLKSPQQTPQCLSSTERLSLKKKMSVLETKLDVTLTKMEAKLEAAGSNLEAMKSKLETTETKLEATQIKLETTQTQLQAAEAKLEATETKLEVTDTNLQSTKALLQAKMNAGSTFVRWGRKTCTNASELVYSGVGGGSSHGHTGAAANMLCLTMKPQSQPFPRPSYYTYLYGAEYQRIQNHHDHDVPCSVCRATQSTTIMIPATRSCPTGWTTQYTGHLVAGHHTDPAATEYVCLDGDPENMLGGHQNHNGHLLYYTFTQCGSLPCPPYSNMAVVLCVVCSK